MRRMCQKIPFQRRAMAKPPEVRFVVGITQAITEELCCCTCAVPNFCLARECRPGNTRGSSNVIIFGALRAGQDIDTAGRSLAMVVTTTYDGAATHYVVPFCRCCIILGVALGWSPVAGNFSLFPRRVDMREVATGIHKGVQHLPVFMVL